MASDTNKEARSVIDKPPAPATASDNAERPENTDAVEGAPPVRLGVRGMRAMQGETDTSQGEPQVGSLDKGQLRGVEVKAARALTTPAVTERNDSKVEAYKHKLQGQIAEQSYLETGAESLNAYKANCPVYDALTPDEVASIKTHMPSARHPDAYLRHYAHDLRVAIGATRSEGGSYGGKSGTEFAAEALNRLEVLPDALKGIKSEDMAAHLQDRATNRIPLDHVKPARQYVMQRARDDPHSYGLPSNASESHVRALVERIKPLPITSEQIKRMVDRRLVAVKTTRF